MTTLDRDHPVWVEVFQIAKLSVRRIANNYRDFVDADDLVQVVMEKAWKRANKVEEYLVREDETERRKGIGALSLMFRREAEKYARKEKASKLGYRPADEFFYRRDLVEFLIACQTLPESVPPSAPSEGGGKGSSLPSESDDLKAMVIDVEAALEKLDGRLRFILESRHGRGNTLQEIAEELDISLQRVDQLERKGMMEVIDLLGGESPYR